MSLLISNGRIAAIGPAARITAPAKAEILDGRGKFLIPGLWNMHVHLGAHADGKRALAAFLAQGVTGLPSRSMRLRENSWARHSVEY